MGNCQTSEAATVVVQHQGGKVEKLYCSVIAKEVMGSNPGHYVAVFIAPPQSSSSSSTSCATPQQNHLKLLRPDDTLQLGHVYRLISFEEVLTVFAAKNKVKLSRLLSSQQQREGNGSSNSSSDDIKKKKRRTREREPDRTTGSIVPDGPPSTPVLAVGGEPRQEAVGDEHRITTASGILCTSGSIGMGTRQGRQWRPVLQTIAEVGN